jgi:glycine/D-amino acid oxidase-like deaminating enzyme
MTEIIVLGAGIGGISMAYELRALIGRKANITLLSGSSIPRVWASLPRGCGYPPMFALIRRLRGRRNCWDTQRSNPWLVTTEK